MFLEIAQNSQGNTCARVSLLMKLQASGQISKNTFLQNTFGRLLLIHCFSCISYRSIKFWLNLSCKILKNDQTYFENVTYLVQRSLSVLLFMVFFYFQGWISFLSYFPTLFIDLLVLGKNISVLHFNLSPIHLLMTLINLFF